MLAYLNSPFIRERCLVRAIGFFYPSAVDLLRIHSQLLTWLLGLYLAGCQHALSAPGMKI